MIERRGWLASVVIACGLAFVLPATAAAATKTFAYTGAAQTWTVPTGVTEATFDLYGAQGGGFGATTAPGLGGRARATTPTASPRATSRRAAATPRMR